MARRFGAGARGAVIGLLLGLSAALAAMPARAGPALVFEPETGAVMHAYDAFQRWHPASLTKLMTVYLLFEGIERGELSLDTAIRLSERAASVTANTMGWPAGTEIDLGDAITILTTKSANDIAIAVAEAVSGTVDAFVARMNDKAQALGMADTRYANPHGLHDARQYTTARDVALLTRALIREFPRFLPSFAVAEGEVRGEPVQSHNRLLGRFPGADGLKTGFVCAAGWNIAASATRDGRRIVAIVLGAVREGQREEVAGEMLDAAFAGSLSSGNLTLEALPRPAATGDPVDMRPYACDGASPPARIASFGFSRAPLPRPRPQAQ